MLPQNSQLLAGLLDHDIEFRPEDFRKICAVVQAIAGINLSDSSNTLVFSRLLKHVRRLNCASFAAYLDIVTSSDRRDELDIMITALTTNTTRFFREPYHFDILRENVLPGLISRAKSGGRIRLWSAGCSSGEEPYTMAAVLLSLFPDANAYDVKILATDINPNVLAAAESGIYKSSDIESVPEQMRKFLFHNRHSKSDYLEIKPDLRKLITFKHLNLIDPWPISGPFNAIFCRNVAIYMDEVTQTRLWQRFDSILDAGGYMFIGHSERLGPERADTLRLCGKTCFVKSDAI